MHTMTGKEKLERLVTKYPDLREELRSLYETKSFGELQSLVNTVRESGHTILVGKDLNTDRYILAYILAYGYLHITKVSTVDLLDAYVSDEEGIARLSDIVDDLVIIRDSPAFMPNKRTANFVTQVLEQNKLVIYYYLGTDSQFRTNMPLLLEYCEATNMKVNTSAPSGAKVGSEEEF